MEMHITADEVRHFLELANRQFEAEGFYLNSVHFHRNEHQICANITLNYTERTEDEQTNGTHLSETHRDSQQA